MKILLKDALHNHFEIFIETSILNRNLSIQKFSNQSLACVLSHCISFSNLAKEVRERGVENPCLRYCIKNKTVFEVSIVCCTLDERQSPVGQCNNPLNLPSSQPHNLTRCQKYNNLLLNSRATQLAPIDLKSILL